MSTLLARAGVAQLVEYELPKLGVAGSNPVARSSNLIVPCVFVAKGLFGHFWGHTGGTLGDICAPPSSRQERPRTT